jgi:hypothetical protein
LKTGRAPRRGTIGRRFPVESGMPEKVDADPAGVD